MDNDKPLEEPQADLPVDDFATDLAVESSEEATVKPVDEPAEEPEEEKPKEPVQAEPETPAEEPAKEPEPEPTPEPAPAPAPENNQEYEGYFNETRERLINVRKERNGIILRIDKLQDQHIENGSEDEMDDSSREIFKLQSELLRKNNLIDALLKVLISLK